MGELGTLGTGDEVSSGAGMGVMRAGVLGGSPSGVGVHRHDAGRLGGGKGSWQTQERGPVMDWLITYRDRIGLTILAGGMLISYLTVVTR